MSDNDPNKSMFMTRLKEKDTVMVGEISIQCKNINPMNTSLAIIADKAIPIKIIRRKKANGQPG